MSRPVWQLPVSENCDGDDGIHPNAKYHCFVDKESLCSKYMQDTDFYETDIESGEIVSNPQISCKICRRKWIKEYNILF